MRTDHIAYQRATQVCGFGFLLQALMGVLLLVFALTTGNRGDTALLFGSIYVLCGLLVWLSLLIVFHQHKLERLEALEEDELAASRQGAAGGGGTGGAAPAGATRSVFDDEQGSRVAARRLGLMHKWLMPAVSLLLALASALLAWGMLSRMSAYTGSGQDALAAGEFARTPALGWAVALCLALAAVSFIFSRFVAGMAQQAAWQNLRGGAAYMVGNALVLFAIAAGVICRFFQNESPVPIIVAWAIPVFMLVMALEIGLNLVLGFYRPRIPGEMPRPAFDSRILSILAAPDTLVRSINEAVNYQFGFDVTSTWGYQLLMRSLAKLLVIAAVVMLLLSTLVIVEPHQQAVRLSGGRVTGDRIYGPGLMLKWPWPFQTASVHDVTTVRALPITAVRTTRALEAARGVNVWQTDLEGKTDRKIEPFLVRRSELNLADVDPDVVSDVAAEPAASGPESRISQSYSLLDAEIILQYRIRQDGAGLLDFLRFAPDARGRRDTLSVRERSLQAIALREASRHFAALGLDEALSRQRSSIAQTLHDRIQAAFDRYKAGVDLVAVNLTSLRPSGTAAGFYVDLMMAQEDRRKLVADSQRYRENSMAYFIGDAARAEEALSAIERYNQLAEHAAADAPPVLEARAAVEAILMAAGGNAGLDIAQAEADRWLKLMSTQADAARVQGQVAVYRAAPELYRVRETMRVLRRALHFQRKFVVDPDRVQVNIQMKDLDTTMLFNQPAPDEGAARTGGSP